MRRSFVTACAVLASSCFAGPLSAGDATPAAGSGARPRLFKDSRLSLAIARAQRRKQVSVLLVAKPGATPAVAAEARRLGGELRYTDGTIGYLRVRIAPDHVTELCQFGSVEAAAMDYDDSYAFRLGPGGSARPGDGAAKVPDSAPPGPVPTIWPPELGDQPLQDPYSPVKDLAAEEFLKKHPTWDGRGVTIALLDGNLDLLLPEFQVAYSLEGKPVPKIADYRNVTDPREDADLNPQWVDMKREVRSRGRKVRFEKKTFTVPRDATYRIGVFSERRFNMESNAAYIDQDIDRDGNPKGDDGLFGVLWDEKTNDVWVDTDRDLDFRDEKAMTDYIVRADVGVFGTDKPDTPVRESIGFAVQTDRENKFVSVNVGVYQHATIIMGSVIGNRERKGRIQGVAPGARLVSMFYGVSNAHGLIEGLIAAFRHPGVDLIVLEQSAAIASDSYLLADAGHPISLVAERLTKLYGKLLFVPGSNSPGFGYVAEDGLAPSAVSVGGYQSKESYRRNLGFVPEYDDNLHWGALSHGPGGAGSLKPDLIAPSGQVSTDPGYRLGEVKKGLYRLPPGYSVDGGTSTATPMAAGATALVVSAAKQSGVPFDAARLKAAITGSTRRIPRLAAHEQGNGLIQVAAAFELLKKLADVQPIVIESRAPVRTKISPLLASPNEGFGLYEREGWKVGDRGERAITLTRTSGPAESMEFSLSWEGNDGTFDGPSSVTLPLGKPIAVPVRIRATKEGAHTAILSIDHSSIPGHVHRVMAAIVVPQRLTSENGYNMKAEITPPAPGDLGVFVEVPPGATALTFSASSPSVYPTLIAPDREGLYPCPFELEPRTPPQCSVARPMPGVWEINVAANRMARAFDPEVPNPLKATPVTITATAAAVEVEVSPPESALDVDRSRPLAVSAENRLGKIAAAANSVDLGAASRKRATISAGEQHLYEVTVPKGASALVARLTDVADPTADLDLYLLDCTEPEKTEEKTGEQEKGNKSPMQPPAICAPVAKAADLGSAGEVEVANPKPGRWVVVVDAFRGTQPSTSYEYVDLYTHPRFGAIAAADLPEERKPSSRWVAKANAWAAGMPEPPRELVGRVTVTSRDVTRLSGIFGQGDKVLIPLGFADVRFEARKTSSNEIPEDRAEPGRDR